MKATKRVLVIAYYFPPMGLSGVQRVAKLVKYLPSYGWHPTVLTVKPGGYFAYDESLLQEVKDAGVKVVRTASLDPTQVFSRQATVRLPKESSRKWLSFISQTLFVPDNKRGWFPFAVAAGRRLLQQESFAAIFSTAPPYTAHLIGASLARSSKLPLIADYRDDWVGNPRHTYPTRAHQAWSSRLEHRVFRAAAMSTVINEPIRRSLANRHPEAASKQQIQIVPQGFDPTDFEVPAASLPSDVMHLLYTGVFYDVQTPDFFLKGLALALAKQPSMRGTLQASFVGLVPEASKALVTRLGLEDMVSYRGYLDHQQTVALQQAADILWLTVGKREGAEQISTSKLFEYIGTRKPILALVPDGAAKQTVEAYGAGVVVDPEDSEGIGKEIIRLYDQWRQRVLPKPKEDNVQRYNRQAIAGEVADLLEEVATP